MPESTLASTPSVQLPPPRRGMGLGLRLVLLALFIIVGVMGGMSAYQLVGEQDRAEAERQGMLRESLAPLVLDLEQARDPQQATERVTQFHDSYVEQGHADHQLALVRASGELVAATPGALLPPVGPVLDAELEVTSPGLDSAPLTLRITQDGSQQAAAVRHHWRNWAIHLVVTAGLILALLALAVRHEVTVPLDRLIRGIGKMELGYWDDMPDPGGAWEIRRVGWRFRVLGQELGRTVEHLVAAQQRAVAVERGAHIDPEWLDQRAPHSDDPPEPIDFEATKALLQGVVAQIEDGDPTAEETRHLAREAWERYAMTAERLGWLDTRNALEDAALRVLDPGGYDSAAQYLVENQEKLEALTATTSAELERTLDARGIPLVDVHYRIKHAAGLWRKMQQKGLELSQVQDLVAIRLVVPTAADCYLALGALHERYDPIVSRFKDYIAAPKSSGYRSLHSTVRTRGGDVFEVQIRSVGMHREAEHGQTSHAVYRAREPVSAVPPSPSAWLRLMERLGLA
ncbi:MAG: bifunctional (p)ppGpp synthetase/guanosine-3',5'-bis(diphosphate) 3'-pyrophosphohydrolase [Oligoflexia bacterium]|nr:bifunctional (p)ppGpp synthetase/guanosine-3',5'-bis(diphosphate) 3'-pyrophosphohydrolase [Oligoflexia bacterium]